MCDHPMAFVYVLVVSYLQLKYIMYGNLCPNLHTCTKCRDVYMVISCIYDVCIMMCVCMCARMRMYVCVCMCVCHTYPSQNHVHLT